MKQLLIIIASIALLPLCVQGQQTHVNDSLVEVSGVVMTADSLRNIPGVSIYIKGKNLGTVANNQGVFDIVVEKGDTLIFSVIGFKKQELIVPDDFEGHFWGIALPLRQDTTYLPPMVVHSYPTKEEFEEAFLHWKIPSNQYELARANTTPERLRAAAYFTGPDGGEGVSNTFSRHRRNMQTKGQIPTINIFNPLAWAKFIKSLKGGKD